MARYYLTTTIPYVNAAPHLGHALEFVQADTVACYHRLAGDEVYFLSGTDENAIKNVKAAEKSEIPIKDFVEQNSKLFQELLSALDITCDQFIRTTEERHVKGVQALWRATKRDDLYKKRYQGLYCLGCELFYKQEELNEQGECFEHPGKPLEEVEEENYFFRLSHYQDWLLELIEKDGLRIIPEKRKNEIIAFIKRGLEDFSVSRPIERSKYWGVPVPGDQSQTIYVWYDALANYITALGYPDQKAELYKKFWSENPHRVHILGKGVSRFHAVYWPAMLASAGLPPPTLEFIHGYLTLDNQKMAKTTGNIIDPFAVIEKYGTDALRYYLLREIPAYDDGDFSLKRFEERYNADLANGLGNLFSRVTNLIATDLDGRLPDMLESPKEFEEVNRLIEEFKFHEALARIWEEVAWANKYINETKPWEAAKTDRKFFGEVISNLVALLYEIAKKLAPFLPETAEKIRTALSAEKIVKAEPLFPRITDNN